MFVLLLIVFESHPGPRTQDTVVYIHMSIHHPELGSLYTLGELDAGERTVFEEHLESCNGVGFGTLDVANFAEFLRGPH